MGTVGRILWGANSYWDSPFQVGAQNLARELVAKGYEIAFVSDPISPLHLLAAGDKATFTGRYATWKAGGRRDLDGRLFYYSPMAPVVPHNKPLLRSRAVLDGWHRLTVPNVVSRIRREGFGRVDLCIVDTTTQHFWLDAVDHRRSVVRVTDLFSGFEKATPAMLARERDMIRRADATVYTARKLGPVVEEAGARRSAYIPNGVNVRRFAEGDRSLPADLAAIPGPRVLYVGALEEWFDVELVAMCARRYPDASFVIVGPPRIDLSALAGLANVHLLGVRSPAVLPSYLWNCDVGLIPFDPSHKVIGTVHPIKLYEYIACGLPVVSTAWDELEAIALDFTRARSRAEFVEAVGAALARGRFHQDLSPFTWAGAAEKLLAAAQLQP